MYTLVGGQARSGGIQTDVKRAEEARAPGGHAQLTAQPVGGVAPVGADTPGAAELCIGLQALAEHRTAAAGPAAVTDTGVEVWARWDEAVALGEDPAGRAHQRLEQRPLRVMAPPTTTTQPRWRTHGLSIRSHRGSGGHDGWMAGVLLPGKRGLVVAGRPVGTLQPSPLLSETSQDRAMSWQVRAMVPSGRRHSSLRLLVQVPGEGGVRGGTHTGPSSPSPFVPQPSQQLLSYQTGLPAGAGAGAGCVEGSPGAGSAPTALVPAPPHPRRRPAVPAHRTGPRCCD